MKKVSSNSGSEGAPSEQLEWQPFGPVADRLVAEVAALLRVVLPELAAKTIWLQALMLCVRGEELSLGSVAHALRKRLPQASDTRRIFGEEYVDDYEPNPDGHDDKRLRMVITMLNGELGNKSHGFELYRQSDLLDATEDALVSENNDVWRMFIRTAQNLASRGSHRALSPFPDQHEFDRLAEEMPNFRPVVDFVVGQVALSRLAGQIAALLPPILLTGEPGIGKTRFARCLAVILKSAFHTIPMASQTATWQLTGLDRSWSSAKPGLVYQALATSAMANVVLLVDEIDKTADDPRYSPLGGLYTLLERDSARAFVDEYVGVPIDASAVIWIVTANTRETIPKPLCSRMTPFHIERPTGHQARLVARSVFQEVRGAANVAPPDDDVIDHLTTLPPREMAAQARVALGRAAHRALVASEEIAYVRVDDFDRSIPREKSMGFV